MTGLPAEAVKVVARQRWENERIARLGFLMGLGWNATRIAGDHVVATTPGCVYAQARRFGLSFREADSLSLDLPLDAHRRFGDAAAKRGLTPEVLIRLLVAFW
jgi:hypothetical protein